MLKVKFFISAVLLTWASSSWAVLVSFDLDGFNFSGNGSATWIHNNPANGNGAKLWHLDSTPDLLTVLWDDANNDGLLTGGETIQSVPGEEGVFVFNPYNPDSNGHNSLGLGSGNLTVSDFMLTIADTPHSDGGSRITSASYDWAFDLDGTNDDISGHASFENIDMYAFNRVILDATKDPQPLSAILWGTLLGQNSDNSTNQKFGDGLGIDFAIKDPDGGTVPEPSTIALLGLGLAGMVIARRRKYNDVLKA